MLQETLEKYEKAKQIYLTENISLTKLCKDFSMSRTRFTKFLKDQNIDIINQQNTHNRYSNIFKKIDTEEKAYWLGFLYADGCVAGKNYTIEIGLSIIDECHVIKFANFINYEGKIKTDDKKVKISFRDKEMHDDLIKHGCIPKKSLVLKFPSNDVVSDNLIHHFVRGYIDGDGYIGHKKANCKIGRLGITCGSRKFLEDLMDKMKWPYAKITKDKRSNALNVNWTAYYVLDMLDDLYKNSKVFLDRKYNKYIEIKLAVLDRAS